MPAQILTENDEKEDKTEFVAIETPPGSDAGSDARGEDERGPKGAENDAEEGDDDRPDSDPEREAIRQRRRKEKMERKQRREEAIARDRLEMDFLRKRNDDLERRLTGVEEVTHSQQISGIDQRYNAALNEARMADQVISKAIAAGNGDDVTKAMAYRDQALAKARELQNLKTQASQRAERQPTMDPRALSYAKAFVESNKWYDPEGRDEDSAIVLAIDQGLIRDGFNPQTAEYWDELRTRAARRLPDRFEQREPKNRDETQDRRPRGGPAIGSGREHAPTSTRREVYISPERKQALIEAGVWDDPVLRARYVKQYAEYDKNRR